jgi:alkylation response protein AidB-like acyl-CoA dehydrogenase
MKTEEKSAVIDTSKMSQAQRAAMELTEAARDTAVAKKHGFCGGLFLGQFDLGALHPYPRQSASDRAQGDAFLRPLEKFLRERVDPDEIDRTGEIPDEVIAELGAMGAFGIKIAPEYGGLGLSQTNYCRAGMLLGSYCGNLTALISAHQSIGVPQPLILFGTEAQKRKYLPRFAKGEISAFALTEPNVGSDPARIETRAEPDGDDFILNGEKLWCTNGVKASVIVVMARTPSKNGKGQITAFIVEMDMPGVEVVRRCRFMGLKALYNAVVRFTNVRVPRENIILAEGRGLRVALTTLNTGRLTLPAACTGLAKRCLETSQSWANERVQWGAAIGKHAAIADKIARMAAQIFAMESMTFYTASLVDRDKNADIRIEAAMCKMWATERTWEIVGDTMQIRGGRGYETAASLAARGERPVPVERWLRDCRINTIFEGSSEILRLFLAREALDPHLQRAGPMLHSGYSLGERFKVGVKAALFYAGWYPRLWFPRIAVGTGFHPALAPHLRYAARTSQRLAGTLFHAMARMGPKLERRQLLLGRFVEIGTELFAITASCAHAQSLDTEEARALADYFCRITRLKIEALFRDVHHNKDVEGYRLAQRVLAGQFDWLHAGILANPAAKSGS